MYYVTIILFITIQINKEVKERNVLIKYSSGYYFYLKYFSDAPFAPKNFTQVESPESTSIRVRWIAIPQNETGEDLTGYKLYYYYEGTNEDNNKTEVKLPTSPNQVNPNYALEEINGVTFLYYTIRSLNPRANYIVWVRGYNIYGDGDSTRENFKEQNKEQNCCSFQPGVNRKLQLQ